jgi:hypothetical protein
MISKLVRKARTPRNSRLVIFERTISPAEQGNVPAEAGGGRYREFLHERPAA